MSIARRIWSATAEKIASFDAALLVVALPLKFYAANYYYVVLLPAAAIATATPKSAVRAAVVRAGGGPRAR